MKIEHEMAEQNHINSGNSISGLTSILSHTILAKGSSMPMPKHQVTRAGNKRHGGKGRNILNLVTIWRFSIWPLHTQVESLVPIKQEKNCISQHFGLGSKEMNIHLWKQTFIFQYAVHNFTIRTQELIQVHEKKIPL